MDIGKAAGRVVRLVRTLAFLTAALWLSPQRGAACSFGDPNCPYWNEAPDPCLIVEFLGRTSNLGGPQNAFCDRVTNGNIGTLERGAHVLNTFEPMSELTAFMNFKEYRPSNGNVYGDICFDETHKIGDELRGVILPDGSLHFGWGIWPASNQTIAAIVGFKGFRMTGFLTYCETTTMETRWHHGTADAIHCQWFGEISYGPQSGGERTSCRLGDTQYTRGLGADVWLIDSDYCTGSFVDERICFKPVP